MASPSSARKKPIGWKRNVARANATRKRWLTLVKDGADYAGKQQYCGTCQHWIRPREWATHQLTHTIAAQTRTPEPLPGSPLKARERARRGAAAQAPQRPQSKAKRKVAADPSEKEGARTVRIWRQHLEQMEQYMATGQGSPPSAVSPTAKGIAESFTRWGDHIPQTRDELQADLVGMTAALAIGANAIRNYAAQAIVGQRLHPAIAGPIEIAADGMDEDRLEFTRAYVLVLRIYASRIEHEEQGGPKPDETFWKKSG